MEAIGYLASLKSLRGAAAGDLFRHGAAAAIVRGEFVLSGRSLLVETEIPSSSEQRRTLLNRQTLRRTGDLRKQVAVVSFQPDDLSIVKGSPSARREACDDAAAALFPASDEVQNRLSTCLRQRNAFLRGLSAVQRRGPLGASEARTLDVWDERLAALGTTWAEYRQKALELIQPRMTALYARLNPSEPADVELIYEPHWLEEGYAKSLREVRGEDVARASTSVGPHRDDIRWVLGGFLARTHASQGQQRALALAFRLALHGALADSLGETPLLLLDDVFSELDRTRQRLLPDLLPGGQVFLATAEEVPNLPAPSMMLNVQSLAGAPPAGLVCS